MKCVVLILFAIFAQIFAKEDPSVTIPLVRHKTAREIAINIKGIKELNTDSLKPNYFKPNPGPTNDSVAIYRYMDNEFYAIIQIGKKARPYNLLVDTAWGHSWVMSEDCPYTKVGCWFHNKYDHTKSSTYVENGTHVNINEGKYNLTGYFSMDTFYLEQLNVTNQTFIEMTDVPSSFALSKADGVLGLGYASLADGVNPVFYNLFKQKKIKNLLFSIYLNRDRSSNRGGNLILGRIEKRHILKDHNITYLSVNESLGYWQFPMDRIVIDNGVKNYTLCDKGCEAIADTSSNTITGPILEIQKINRIIGARHIMNGRYQVPCDIINKLPIVDFIIGGNIFLIHGRDYVQQMSYKFTTLCLSAFAAPDNKDQQFWSLGGAFLSEYYSIYNLQQNIIGFVKAA